MAIDVGRPVGALVAERFSRAAVFDRLGLDYCCHGDVPLAAACRELGLELDPVTAQIEASDAESRPADEPDFRAMPLGQLAEHIELTHHAFMREALPRLRKLQEKVEQAHGDRHPELREVGQTLSALHQEIDSHLLKEERILFPMIRRLEASATVPHFPCGSIDNPIRVMEHEHDDVGGAIERLRTLTAQFTVPADGCSSYRALIEGLAALEADLHRHIHKENNILFPRASALEAALPETSEGA